MELISSFNKCINEQLGLTTLPIAVKLLEQGDSIPNEVGRPLRDLGEPVTPCGGWNLARHLNLPIVMLEEDFSTRCPTGLFVFGILEPIKQWIEGDLAYGIYASSREAAANMEKNVFRLPVGKYKGVAFAPLGKEYFVPDLVMIYCNSKQAMLLTTAVAWANGEALKVTIAARNVCSDGIVQPFQIGRPVVAIPCGGDREYGGTQDTEIVFTTPLDRLEGIINGLELSERAITIGNLGEKPKLIKQYEEMGMILDEKLGRKTTDKKI